MTTLELLPNLLNAVSKTISDRFCASSIITKLLFRVLPLIYVKGKTSNPFAPKKVMMDVPDNVNEDELAEANKESEKDFQDRQKRLAAAGAETAKDPARLKRMSAIPGYTAAMDLAKKTTTKEEVEQVDERTLTKGETAEKERIVKGMKKSLAGFKSRYGERAKEVMYATATKQAKKD
jgi:hypothetical protein